MFLLLLINIFLGLSKESDFNHRRRDSFISFLITSSIRFQKKSFLLVNSGRVLSTFIGLDHFFHEHVSGDKRNINT